MSWPRGQDELVKSFTQVVSRGRLAHAYLFVGPAGVGKKAFAFELGKSLLCEARVGLALVPCGQCTACVQVAAGTHPDLLVFGMPEEKHEFPKEVIQELIRHLSMKPARGKKRVTIVEDADQLNEESANAFLKTLEEPPPSSLLILLGTSPDFQLPTIRSRCQIIRFQAVSREAVAELLVAEGVVGDLPQARRLADLGSGSLLRARILAEPNVIDFRAKLLAALDRLPFASVSLAQESWKLIEEAGKETSLQRRRAQLLLDLLIEFFRGVLLVQQGVTVSWPDPRDGEIAQRITHRLDTEQLLRVIDRCLTASNQIDRRVMLALLVEGLFDSLGVLLEGNPVAF